MAHEHSSSAAPSERTKHAEAGDLGDERQRRPTGGMDPQPTTCTAGRDGESVTCGHARRKSGMAAGVPTWIKLDEALNG
jgi:hypothetical protein